MSKNVNCVTYVDQSEKRAAVCFVDGFATVSEEMLDRLLRRAGFLPERVSE